MKILLATGIYPPDAGGPATYTRGLARALVERGHEVEVVCYADDDWDRRTGNDEMGISIEVHRVFRSLPLLRRYFDYFKQVYFRARTADLVYLQGPVSEGLPGALATWLTGNPYFLKVVGDYAWEVYMQSDDDGGRGKESLDEFLQREHKGKIGWIEKAERLVARGAKRVIVPSVYLRRVVRRWGVLKERISVINNAVSVFPIGLDRDVFRRDRGLENKKVIFTAVRAVPWKNIDFIIRLIPSLADDAIFVIAGEGPLYDEWKDLACEMDLETRVRFVGKLNKREMGEWYRAADVFVLPSDYEGFPHVIPEAASFGLPCLVSDMCGNPETEHHFPTLVRILPYLDTGAWISALNNVKIRRAVKVPERLHFDQMIELTMSVLGISKKI